MRGGLTNGRTDGRTDERTNGRTKVPLCSTGLRPLRGRCPKKERNKRTQYNKQNNSDAIPENLFDVLPFKDECPKDEEYKPFAHIPFIPGGTSYRLKRSLAKAGVNTCFTSGTKLKDILCSKNKSKIDPAKNKRLVFNDLSCLKNFVYVY